MELDVVSSGATWREDRTELVSSENSISGVAQGFSPAKEST